MGESWKGGNMNHLGGGYKINLLKKAIKPLVQQNNIIIFTDSLVYISLVIHKKKMESKLYK